MKYQYILDCMEQGRFSLEECIDLPVPRGLKLSTRRELKRIVKEVDLLLSILTPVIEKENEKR